MPWRHVDAGAYTLGRFHRTVRMYNQPNNAVKIEVIQTGSAHAQRLSPPVTITRISRKRESR